MVGFFSQWSGGRRDLSGKEGLVITKRDGKGFLSHNAFGRSVGTSFFNLRLLCPTRASGQRKDISFQPGKTSERGATCPPACKKWHRGRAVNAGCCCATR